jgi:hypothetical protein
VAIRYIRTAVHLKRRLSRWNIATHLKRWSQPPRHDHSLQLVSSILYLLLDLIPDWLLFTPRGHATLLSLSPTFQLLSEICIDNLCVQLINNYLLNNNLSLFGGLFRCLFLPAAHMPPNQFESFCEQNLFFFLCLKPCDQGVKLKGYYPYFGVQPFTFPSKYFATLQKGRGHFM